MIGMVVEDCRITCAKQRHESEFSPELCGLSLWRSTKQVVGFTSVGRVDPSVEGEGGGEADVVRDLACLLGEVFGRAVWIGERGNRDTDLLFNKGFGFL